MKQKTMPLDVFGKVPNTLRVCTWHETGQMFLHMFFRTDGICPLCFDKVKSLVIESLPSLQKQDEFIMKNGDVQWVKLLHDGGWKQLPGSGYFPRYVRCVGPFQFNVDHMTGTSATFGWRVVCVNIYRHEVLPAQFEGTLSECLEWSDERI
jgi:hypothetical protein